MGVVLQVTFAVCFCWPPPVQMLYLDAILRRHCLSLCRWSPTLVISRFKRGKNQLFPQPCYDPPKSKWHNGQRWIRKTENTLSKYSLGNDAAWWRAGWGVTLKWVPEIAFSRVPTWALTAETNSQRTIVPWTKKRRRVCLTDDCLQVGAAKYHAERTHS